jgi:hypothetical protein
VIIIDLKEFITKIKITTMPMRQFKKTKRVIKREEQISMHESAKAAAERYRQEKERLIAEGKLRRELIKVDDRTTIVRYIPIKPEDPKESNHETAL